MVRYPSGFHRKEGSGEAFVLGCAAAISDHYFLPDKDEVARYTEHGGWSYYTPGLFRFTGNSAGYDNLKAGMPGKPPALTDGQALAAGFVAPHDLEVDAQGRFYVIDEDRIRTIDADYKVATLDPVALGITGTVRALDADHQGRIHVIAQRNAASYSWHRLENGSTVDFGINRAVMTEPLGKVTFTVVGDGLVVNERRLGGALGRLYKVSANGAVTAL